VAGWQRDIRNFVRVPCRHDHTTRVRSVLDQIDDVLDLIDVATVRLRPGSPLDTVDGTEVTVLLGEGFVVDEALLEELQLRLPFERIDLDVLTGLLEVLLEWPLCPDVDALLHQIPNVAVGTHEPQKFLCDPREVDALRRQQGEYLLKVVPDLTSEDASCSGTGTISLDHTIS